MLSPAARACLQLNCIQILFLKCPEKSPAVTQEFEIQSNLSFEGKRHCSLMALCARESVHVCCLYSDSFICGIRESSNAFSPVSVEQHPAVYCSPFPFSQIITFTSPLDLCEKNKKTATCQGSYWVLRARLKCLKCVFSSLQVFRPSWQIPVWGGTPLWELLSGWLRRYSKTGL